MIYPGFRNALFSLVSPYPTSLQVFLANYSYTSAQGGGKHFNNSKAYITGFHGIRGIRQLVSGFQLYPWVQIYSEVAMGK